MLVELKNGETFNGHLVNCDNWMNLTLREVIQTSPEGDRFWRLPECYIRGNTIIEMVKDDAVRQRQQAPVSSSRGRGGRSGKLEIFVLPKLYNHILYLLTCLSFFQAGGRDGSSRGRGGGGGSGRGKSTKKR
ncbi:hypothetical protein C2G38_2037509 [Gigaspora rosea]|uniref:LSM complex subunit LSM4 n=1 Tax=Gigaspora rosea TaxID=44941 RepID=A0A397V8P3_9GLOM|nr:hypothetical protein C2G38_2037509 [Gigaspora rosea]